MIFVDTSYWVALRNRKDLNHAAAAQLVESTSREGWVTTNQVLGETRTFLRRRAGHRAAVDFLDAVEHSPRLRVITVQPEEEKDAWRWLRRHDEREYSFVDATSYVTMRGHRIYQVLAFAGDFSAAGFHELRP